MRTFCLAVILAMCTVAVSAHGPAQWIQDGRYRNAVGDLCCGERDCVEIPDSMVTVTAAGYHVRGWIVGKWVNEDVPYPEAQPTPTGEGHFWRCAWGGMRKCFFAPRVGS